MASISDGEQYESGEGHWCPSCNNEFVPELTVCPDCKVTLEPKRAKDDPPTDPTQVSRDLSPWAGESREMLTALLNGRGVMHAWQGAVLVTRGEDESTVEQLVAETEAASRPVFDDEQPKVVYEVGDWPVQTQSEVARRLADLDIAHEWDENGDLVVLESDEERVDAVMDDIELPDRDDPGSDGADEPLPEAITVMNELFFATDRLKRNVLDPDAVLDTVRWSQTAERLPLPFGFEPAVWKDIVGQATKLRLAIEDEGAADADVKELAESLSAQLRNYV